jgi:DNA polymerase/3'-5' exonuclease PolX
MKLLQAKELAIKVGKRLQPFCTRINIAGSIRREKQEVGDIELICLPRIITSAQEDLFSEVIVERRVSNNFIAEVKQLGRVIKGKPDGKYMQIELPERINLDLFMPSEPDYIRQYVIRTGSAEYAYRTIAAAWKRKGWCGTEHGLRKISDCIEHKQSDGKSKWECIKMNPELPPCWAEEKDFFDWLGVHWIQPKLRNI